MISWLGRWGQTCVLEYSNVAEHLILKLRPLKVHSKDHSVSDFLPPKVWIFYTQLCSVQRTRGFHVCTYILGEMQRGFWIASWDGCTSWTVQSLSWLVTIKGLLLVTCRLLLSLVDPEKFMCGKRWKNNSLERSSSIVRGEKSWALAVVKGDIASATGPACLVKLVHWTCPNLLSRGKVVPKGSPLTTAPQLAITVRFRVLVEESLAGQGLGRAHHSSSIGPRKLSQTWI